MSDHRPLSPGLRGVLDYGPLAAFLAVFLLLRHQTVHWGGADYPGMIVATVVFVPLAILANAVLWLRTGRLSALQLITLAVVVVFGGLTVWLNDPRFIKMKPTIIYSLFGLILGGGLLFHKSFIAVMFDQMFNLTPAGWRALTFRWALFFLAMAVLNEVIWRTQTTDFWVAFKAFGAMPITAVFAMSQMPLINRHSIAPATADASDVKRGDV